MSGDAEGLREIWVCVCGCSTFRFYGDGTSECAGCDLALDGAGSWYEFRPDGGYRTDTIRSVVHGNGSISFARERLRRAVLSDDVRMLVAARADGTLSTWFGCESEKQRRWMKRRMKEAMRILKGIR